MKKPGEFKAQQKKHQNIQHNRDQLKLLKEEKIQEAELFVLDPDGFKKVTIKPINWNAGWDWLEVVYLQRKKENTKLRTGTLTTKDGLKVGDHHANQDEVYGEIVKVELLKPSELNPPTKQ